MKFRLEGRNDEVLLANVSSEEVRKYLRNNTRLSNKEVKAYIALTMRVGVSFPCFFYAIYMQE